MLGKVGCAVMIAAAVASAQPPDLTGGGAAGGGRSGVMGAGMSRRSQSRFDTFADKLKLNKDQKAQAQSLISEARKEAEPAQQAMFEARGNLAGSLINGQSGDRIAPLTRKYAEAAAQLAAIEAKTFAKIVALMKPKDQPKAGPNFELLAEIFGQSPGGSRGEGN
jgi:Spy/CpxP family protein refolding chaperone